MRPEVVIIIQIFFVPFTLLHLHWGCKNQRVNYVSNQWLPHCHTLMIKIPVWFLFFFIKDVFIFIKCLSLDNCTYSVWQNWEVFLRHSAYWNMINLKDLWNWVLRWTIWLFSWNTIFVWKNDRQTMVIQTWGSGTHFLKWIAWNCHFKKNNWQHLLSKIKISNES